MDADPPCGACNSAFLYSAHDFYTTVIGLKEIPGSANAAGPNRVGTLSFSDSYEDSSPMVSKMQADSAPINKCGTLQRLAFRDANAIVALA